MTNRLDETKKLSGNHRTSHYVRCATSLVAILFALQGCTTSLVSRGDPGGGTSLPGVGYRLPYRQLRAELQVTLATCKTDTTTGLTEIEFKPAVQISESLDEGERIVIDYQQLSKPFKTGNMKLVFWTIGTGEAARTTGLLKSVNVETKGEEVAAINAATSVFTSLASIAAKVAFPVGAAANQKGSLAEPAITCNNEITTNLDLVEKANDRLEAIGEKLDEITKRVASLGLVIINDKIPDAVSVELIRLKLEGIALEKERARITQSLLVIEPSLTFKQTFKFDDLKVDAADPMQAIFQIVPDQTKFGKFVSNHVKIETENCNEKLVEFGCNTDAVITSWLKPLTLVARIRSDGPGRLPVNVTPISTASKGYQGIVYRSPVPVTVSIEGKASGPEKPLAMLKTNMPQLGPVGRMTLRNGLGEHNILTANFAQDGALIDFEYKSQRASGVAFLESAKTIAEAGNSTLQSWQTSKNAAKVAEESSPLKTLQDRISVLKAQKELDTLSVAPSPEQAARDAELSSLQHRFAVAELEAKLKALKDE